MLSQYTIAISGKRGQPTLSEWRRRDGVTIPMRQGDPTRLLRPLTATFRELVERRGFRAAC